MTHNNSKNIRVLLILLALGLGLSLPERVDASCAPPDPVPLWWSPVKYATDVPLDTVLYVGPAYGQVITVTFNGEVLSPMGGPLGGGTIAYSLPELEADTNYEFVMEVGATDAGSTSKKVKSNFTTGNSANGTIPTETIDITDSTIWDNATGQTISDECSGIYHGQDCFDTGGYTAFILNTSADVVGYAVRTNVAGDTGGWRYWPATCPIVPTILGPTSPETCVEIQPLYAQGPGTMTTLFCPLDPNSMSNEEEAGCRLAASESNMYRGLLWVFFLLGILFSLPYGKSITGSFRRSL